MLSKIISPEQSKTKVNKVVVVVVRISQECRCRHRCRQCRRRRCRRRSCVRYGVYQYALNRIKGKSRRNLPVDEVPLALGS